MRLSALLLTACLLLALPARAHAEHVYDSDHLRISGDVPEAWIDRAAGLGNELYAALREHFGRTPDETQLPLELVLYAQRSSFDKALRLRGVKGHATHAGGWTVWKTGVSHVWLQPEPFDTRRLILHELCHQFHDKCRDPARRAGGAWWYREGLAEWFGWHRRTAQGLQFGALDAVALNDLARRAAARVLAKDFDPWAVGTGKTRQDYVDALALVGGLMRSRDADIRARFGHWEREVLAKGGDARAFARRFEERRKDLAGAIRMGWSLFRGQWRPSSSGWDELNGVISADRRGRSTLLREGAPVPAGFVTRVEVVTGTEPAAAAGVALTLPGGRGLRVLVDRDGLYLEPRPPRAGARPPRVKLRQGRKTVLEVIMTPAGLDVAATRAGKRHSLRFPLQQTAVLAWGFDVEGTAAHFRPLPPERGK